MRYSQYVNVGVRRERKTHRDSEFDLSRLNPNTPLLPISRLWRTLLCAFTTTILRLSGLPVEGKSRHPGAAAVVAQAGVHPGLGEDDIDLVLLGSVKRRVNTPMWPTPTFLKWYRGRRGCAGCRVKCVPWRLCLASLQEAIMRLFDTNMSTSKKQTEAVRYSWGHSNTFLFYAFDMEISSAPSRNLFTQTLFFF